MHNTRTLKSKQPHGIQPSFISSFTQVQFHLCLLGIVKKKKKKDLLAECFSTRVNEVEKIKRSWKFVLCLVNSNLNKKSPAQGRRPCPGGFNSKEMSHVRYRIEAWRLKRRISVTTERAPSIHWWILCGAAEKPPEEVPGGLWVGIVGDLIPVSKEPLTN